MSRAAVLSLLESYKKTWANPHFFSRKDWQESHDLNALQLFTSFIEANPDCFERSLSVGHMTGSACVVNDSLTKVLLTHHRKLGMWLQLGGHADGNPHLHDVAMTEAHEESGLSNLYFLRYEESVFDTPSITPIPFDLDAHVIPANKRDGEHMHYDMRFILVGDDDERPVVSEESHDVRWFTIDEARAITSELSMHRQFGKIEALRVILNC